MILIGFMGAGKTTIGRKLSEKLGVELIDLDEEIIKEIQMPIAEYFELYGEPAFRELEHNHLKRLHNESAIISTGGGCVETVENRQLLKQSREVIYLHAEFNTLWSRIMQDTVNVRPVATNKTPDELEAVYNIRLPLYEECADYIVKTDSWSTEEVVQKILNLMEK